MLLLLTWLLDCKKVGSSCVEEMTEEESRLLGNSDSVSGSSYSAHTHALLMFMEKTAMSSNTTECVDRDVDVTPVRTYKLSSLYLHYL